MAITQLDTQEDQVLAPNGSLQSRYAPASVRLSMDVVEQVAVERPLFHQPQGTTTRSKTSWKHSTSSQKSATKIDVPSRNLSFHVARTGHE